MSSDAYRFLLDAIEYRRTHRRGSARIIKAKRDAIHAALAGKAVR